MTKKRLVLSMAVAAVVLLGVWLFWPDDNTDSRYWQHTFHDDQVIYVDDRAVRDDDALTPAQDKLEQLTLFLEMERLYETYQHYTTFAEGMSSKQPGLGDEMNARYAVLYESLDGALVGKGTSTNDFYVRFHEISVQGDVAKVVCSYRIQGHDAAEPIVEESEVIFWERGAADWVYTNIISTEGGVDMAFFEEVCANDNPADWQTTYAFTNLKRSTYASDGMNYTDYGVWHERMAMDDAVALETEPEAMPKTAPGPHLADYKRAEGVYTLMGTEKSRARFAPEELALHVQFDGKEGKVARRFNRSNMAAIQDVVTALNRTYLASLYSGEWRLVPRDRFASDAIYKEANARSLVAMVQQPNLGVNADDAWFGLYIETVRIRGDWAKVIVSRSETVGYHMNVQPAFSRMVQEGYILKKVDGDWRIENILFSNGAPTRSLQALQSAATNAKDWQSHYSFAALRHSDDPGGKNYSDYIQGDVEDAVLRTE